MVELSFDGQNFICRANYEDRLFPRQAHFNWDSEKKHYWTPNISNASRLRRFADVAAENEFRRKLVTVTPWAGVFTWKDKSLTPKDFQFVAARWALERNRSYLALDPRLGKTIVASLIVNAAQDPTIYICPAFLTLNTQELLRQWLEPHLTVGVLKPQMTAPWPDVVIVPDSMLERDHTQEFIRVFVLNAYNNLRDVWLFGDEAHRFKEMKAKRTKMYFEKIGPQFDRIVDMSGTPMVNRPIELYSVLHYHAPETIDFQNIWAFAQKYCGGDKVSYWIYDRKLKKRVQKFRINMLGSSNLEELFSRIKEKFMLRIKREDVVDEIGSVEEMVVVNDTMPPHVARMDKELNQKFTLEDLMQSKFGDKHFMAYRQELGVHKAPFAIEYINHILETTEEKILVFAHHKSVIDLLWNGIRKPNQTLKMTSDMTTTERQRVVEKYQSDPKVRVMIGNIQVMGLGWPLWRANRTILVEYSWQPGENKQAIDRQYFMGKQESTFAQYIVFKDSIDARILAENFRKQEDIKKL